MLTEAKKGIFKFKVYLVVSILPEPTLVHKTLNIPNGKHLQRVSMIH